MDISGKIYGYVETANTSSGDFSEKSIMKLEKNGFSMKTLLDYHLAYEVVYKKE